MRLRAVNRLAALLLAVCGAACAAAQGPNVGAPAPEFVRADLHGAPVDLAALRGKVVLLNFWATWCAPCQKELPLFAAWRARYAVEGFAVVAVSMDDDAAPVRALVEKKHWDLPVVMGDDKLGTLYGGVLGFPVTYLIARDGTITARVEGETDLDALETRVKALLAAK